MVGGLLGLKWRLLVNGRRADRQRAIGLPLLLLASAATGIWLGRSFLETGRALPDPAAGELAAWTVTLLWGAWVVLPVILFPVDEPLDPARLVQFPIRRPTLLAGLAAAGLVTPPILVPLGILAADLLLFTPSGVGAFVALAALVVLLGHLVVTGQAFSTLASLVFRSPRGRDVAVILVTGLGLAGFVVHQLIIRRISTLGLELALLEHPLIPYWVLIPPLGAQQALRMAGSGSWAAALVPLLVSLGWLVGVGTVWHRIIDHLVTTPDPSGQVPGADRRANGLGRVGGPIPAIAAKELLFYLRDPRLRAVWTGAILFLGVIAASLLVGNATLTDFRSSAWMTTASPLVVLFVGLPVALNQIGWERNAATFLFALPARPRDVLMGKNLAVATILFLEAAIVATGMAWLTNGWSRLPLVPILALAAIACQLAVGNLISVLTPLRLPRPGTDLFAQATEQGCLALLAQMAGFGAIGMLLAIPASAMLLAEWGVLRPVTVALASAGWGVLVYMGSLLVAQRLLARRVPELVSAVQTH